MSQPYINIRAQYTSSAYINIFQVHLAKAKHANILHRLNLAPPLGLLYTPTKIALPDYFFWAEVLANCNSCQKDATHLKSRVVGLHPASPYSHFLHCCCVPKSDSMAPQVRR